MQKNSKLWNSFQSNCSYLCFLLLSILVSCTATDTATNTNTATEQTVVPAPQAPQRKEFTTSFDDEILRYRKNPELNIASSRTYSELDPHGTDSTNSTDGTGGSEDFQLIHALYAGLTTLNPLTNTVRPALAKYWQSSMQEEGYTYTFSLREVYWTDGQRLTATQVQQSLLRIIRAQERNIFASVFAASILGGDQFRNKSLFINDEQRQEAAKEIAIRVVDEYTVSIATRFAEVPLLQMLAHPQAAILPIENFIEDLKDNSYSFALDPQTWNGIGPYVPVSLEENVLTLKAREGFWSEVWVDQIRLHMGLDADEQKKQYEAATLDWIVEYPDLLPAQEELPVQEGLGEKLRKKREHESTSGFASLVFIDIPWASVLHDDFSRDDFKNAGRTLFANEVAKTNREFHIQSIVDLLDTLRDHFFQNSYLQYTRSFFFPYQIFRKDIKLANHHTQQLARESDRKKRERAAAAVAATTSSAAAADSAADADSAAAADAASASSEAESKIVGYAQVLYQYLQRKNKAFRIAYDSPVLYEVAKIIRTQYLEPTGIKVELVQILAASSKAQEYDLALRLFHPVVDEHYATILSLWYTDKKESVDKPASNRYRTNGVQNVLVRLAQLDAKKRRTKLESFLVEWNKTIQQQRRFVPVWFYRRNNRIDTEKFQWWTAQEQAWHPLYP